MARLRHLELAWAGLLIVVATSLASGATRPPAAVPPVPPALPDPPILHLRFDEAAGADRFASATSALEGTCTGDGCPTAGVAGAMGRALAFDGADDAVDVADAPMLRLFQYTESLWFQWDDVGTESIGFLTARGGGHFEIHTGGDAGANGIRVIPAGHPETSLDLPAFVQPGWNHLTVTYGAGEVCAYREGVLVTCRSVSGGADLTMDGAPFRVGRRGDGSYPFRGRIDDVRLYDHVLTAAEIATLPGCAAATECDDGDPCDGVEACEVGRCVDSTPLDCDDYDPCSDDFCIPTLGCAHATNTAPCPDDDPCNGDDVCADGVCGHGESLPDGTACREEGACDAGVCVLPCDDGNPCTDDTFDRQTRTCVFADNTASCSATVCSFAYGEVYYLPAARCRDGECVYAEEVHCFDDDPCTEDRCESTGCTFVPSSTATCGEAACSTDGRVYTAAAVCVAGVCPTQGTTSCDDGDPCTVDTCRLGFAPGCVHAPVCDDGDPCTADLCDPTTLACTHATEPDGQACGGGQRCEAGACTCRGALGLPGAPTVPVEGAEPTGLAAGDLDGDGLPDLVVAVPGGAHVEVLLGRGDGTFTAGAPVALGESPAAVALGDVDGDQVLDLVVADSATKNVHVLPGLPDATFGAATALPQAATPGPVALADLDGDGALDLVVGYPENAAYEVLLGAGDGTFTAWYEGAARAPQGIAVGDLRGDGTPDLAFFGSDVVDVAMGRGDGAFDPGDAWACEELGGVVLVDVTADGLDDFVAGCGDREAVVTRAGDGQGGFGVATESDYDAPGGGLVVEDLTHDGVPDVVCVGGDHIGFSEGVGHGAFGEMATFPAAQASTALVTVDFGGDGRVGVVALTTTEMVAVFLPGADEAGPRLVAPDQDWGPSKTRALALGDVNRDGLVDLVHWRDWFGATEVWEGHGDGTFSTDPTWQCGAPEQTVDGAIVDLNDDGLVDLVALDAGGTLDVALGTPDGPCGPHHAVTTPTELGALASGDVDGDRRPDLVVVDAWSGDVSILRNTATSGGDPTFLAEELTGGESAFDVALADLDGDGALDVVTADFEGDSVLVRRGAGDGTFGEPAAFVVGDAPRVVTVADLDGDGAPDLATLSQTSGLSVLLGRRTAGALAFADLLSAPFVPGRDVLVAADLFGGERAALVAFGQWDGTVAVFFVDRAGTLRGPTRYPGGENHGSMAAADLDGDGRADLVTQSPDYDGRVVFRSTCLPVASCDDGDPCTDDTWDIFEGGCVHAAALPAQLCAGRACGADGCGGSCGACDDGNSCTAESCDEATGQCSVTVYDGGVCAEPRCEGGLHVAASTCVGGACPAGATTGCDDGNVCTTDRCDPAAGCAHADNAETCAPAACEEGGFRAAATCAGGECPTVEATSCDDGNACTDDACDAAAGCTHVARVGECAPARCEDGAVLPAATCGVGACAPSAALLCDDGDPCTVDACDEATGCSTSRIPGCCHDDGECVATLELCRGGVCVDVLCRACETDADCGTSGSRCLALPSGARCGVVCDAADAVCPDGSTCRDVEGGLAQCVPDDGDCACTSQATTACEAGDLVWQTSCGETEDVAEDCGGRGCVDAACCPMGQVERGGECAGPPVEGGADAGGTDVAGPDVVGGDIAGEIIAGPDVAGEDVTVTDLAGPDALAVDVADATVRPDAAGDELARPDAGAKDVARPDAPGPAMPDIPARADTTAADVTTSGGGSGGGCATTPGAAPGGLAGMLLAALALALVVRRRAST